MPSKTATTKSAAPSKPGKGADRDKTVARMIELRTKENLGVNAIAARLDEEGYPTFGAAKKWPHRVVYGVLLKELGASKMKLKTKASKATQTGNDKRRDTSKTPPAPVEKLSNGNASDLTDVPGAVVVRRGDKKTTSPDPKSSTPRAGAKSDVAQPTPTTRRSRAAAKRAAK